MRKRVIAVASAVAFVIAVGVIGRAQDKAASVAGNWEVTQQGRNGAVTQTLTLEQMGGTLTGTIKGQNGDTPVNGTIEGNNVTLTIKRTTQNGEVTQEYKGTVEGDSMKGMVTTGQRSGEWSATRSKS